MAVLKDPTGDPLGVFPCLILDSDSLIILYVHEHRRLGFWMFTVKTVFSIWLHLIINFSSCDRKSQSRPVEYCLESVDEYSEGKIHKGESVTRSLFTMK